MREHQFLEKLAQTPRTWYLHGEMIRARDIDTEIIHCPITAVATQMGVEDAMGGHLFAAWAGVRSGLSGKTVNRLIAAADGQTRYPTLRKRVMRACGLRATRRRHRED